jgi:uncharacterized Rossmann fold enzyme
MRCQTWDAITDVDSKRKRHICSGMIKLKKLEAAKEIKSKLGEEIFEEFKEESRK